MRKLMVLFIFISSGSFSFCQCIDKSKIGWGGDWEFTKYQYLSPAFNFVINGDTSKHWEIIRDIDIKQVATEVNPIKKYVEQRIKSYSGNKFFSRLKFISVSIVYPDSIKRFWKSGDSSITMKYCKAKYYFYYEFIIDSDISYNVGIAVNKQGRIISNFNIPTKSQYVPIIQNLSICKALEIARKISRHIDPINEVIINYDKKTHRFYWLISQEVLNEHEGRNKVNQVLIDAANPKIVRVQAGEAFIVF